MGHNRKLLRECMAQPGPKKLQIGTFTNLLPC